MGKKIIFAPKKGSKYEKCNFWTEKKDRIFGLKLYFFPRFRSLCNFTNTTEYQQSFQKPVEKMEMPKHYGDTTNSAGRISNTEFVLASTVLTSSLPKSKFSFKKV